MSDMELRGDYQNNILVLGMLSDGPLEKFLKDYPHIRKIQFCLDNDLRGRQAAKKLARKYTLWSMRFLYVFHLWEKIIMLFCSIKRKTRSFPAW